MFIEDYSLGIDLVDFSSSMLMRESYSFYSKIPQVKGLVALTYRKFTICTCMLTKDFFDGDPIEIKLEIPAQLRQAVKSKVEKIHLERAPDNIQEIFLKHVPDLLLDAHTPLAAEALRALCVYTAKYGDSMENLWK